MPNEVTDEQIRELQQKGTDAKDVRTVKTCSRALHGDVHARERCAEAIAAGTLVK